MTPLNDIDNSGQRAHQREDAEGQEGVAPTPVGFFVGAADAGERPQEELEHEVRQHQALLRGRLGGRPQQQFQVALDEQDAGFGVAANRVLATAADHVIIGESGGTFQGSR